MVDRLIKYKLLERDGKYNFKALVSFIETSGFDYTSKELRGPLAIATLNGVLINISLLDRLDDKFIFFVLLHETAHMKRINKMGKAEIIRNLSLDNFNEFMGHIIHEEVLADRYACKLFYSLNKEIYPWDETQQLNLPDKQKQYEQIAMGYYGHIQNDEKKYDEMINSFIIK